MEFPAAKRLRSDDGAASQLQEGVSFAGGGAVISPSCANVSEGTTVDQGVGEVRKFLQNLGLHVYLQKFIETGFDMMEAVRVMDRSDMLQECDMTADHANVLEAALSKPSAPLEAMAQITASGPCSCQFISQLPPATSAPPSRPSSQACLAPSNVVPNNINLPGHVGACSPGQIGAAMFPCTAGTMLSVAGAPTGAVFAGVGANPCIVGCFGLCSQTGFAVPASIASQTDGFSTEGFAAAVSSTAKPPESPVPGTNALPVHLKALLNLAEECAQMSVAAAAFCASPTSGPSQIAIVSDAAQDGSQRAGWAATIISNFVQQQSDAGVNIPWLQELKIVALKAASSAEVSAQACQVHAANARETCLDPHRAKRSRVPCKNHLAGRCSKGASCDFSHDPADMEARPIKLKSMKQCIFYAKGGCMRGPACPFSHGEDESREIEKYVDILRKEKSKPNGTNRRQ